MAGSVFDQIEGLSRSEFRDLRKDLKTNGGDAFYDMMGWPGWVSESGKKNLCEIFLHHGVSTTRRSLADACFAVMGRAVDVR